MEITKVFERGLGLANYMTAEALAKALKKHPETIRRLCREGKIPAKKLGGWLIKEEDFDRILEEYTKKYFEEANA